MMTGLKIFRSVFLAAFIMGMPLPGCTHHPTQRDVLFQTSTIYALMDGAYDGTITFGVLKKHGDTGIGTFEGLDGEMIGVDGEYFQIKADGAVYPVDDSMKASFAMVTFFEPDKTILIDNLMDEKTMEKYLDGQLPVKNIPYAFKIQGDFSFVRTRSVPRQNKPYPPLAEAVKNQSVFEFHDVKGMIVGFRFPDYMKGINMPGYHFHFITEDRKSGGHLLDCRIKKGNVQMDETYDFYMVLPKNENFYKKELTGDKQEELERLER